MADVAQGISTSESELWPQGTFGDAYRLNREQAVDDVVQLDPLANAIRQIMTARNAWTGTATKLIAVQENLAWPGSPRLWQRDSDVEQRSYARGVSTSPLSAPVAHARPSDHAALDCAGPGARQNQG
jgi:hypothetical protein